MSQAQQWDEVYQLLSWWDAKKISTAKVMVVGAGALGNEVLKNLALLNLGYIFIVDFDHIEYSNLSRSILFRPSDVGKSKASTAAEQIKSINSNCRVYYLHGDIAFDVGLGLFARMDVIIGCLDNRIARLYINRHAHRLNKTWINGGIINISGLVDVFKPGRSCYECQLRPEEKKIIQFRIGCTDIAKRNANFGRLPTTPLSASLIGAYQVIEAFKVIYENEEKSLVGQRLFIDGESNEFLTYPAAPLQEFCLSHGKIETVLRVSTLSAKMSVGELQNWLKTYFNHPNPRISLEEYDLVCELYNENSGESHEVFIPRFRISNEFLRNFQQVEGEMIRIPPEKTLNFIDNSFPHPEKSLIEIGIPPLQILPVEINDDIIFVELSGDCELYGFENDYQEEEIIKLNT